MKKVLTVSYFASRQACCPAEWVDDKLDSFFKLGYKQTLICSIWSKGYDFDVKHIRVPSLSPEDFKMEKKEFDELGLNPITLYFWYPFIYTFGYLFEVFQNFLIKGNSGGKWSWTFTSFIVTFWHLLFNRYDVVLTTGGPASCHISGIVAAKLTFHKVVSELQDPLAGEGIGRNSRSASLLTYLEKFIVKFADKVVFVTELAGAEALDRYSNSPKISSIYPAAKKFPICRSQEKLTSEPIKFIHLGTFYSTRNLDTFIISLEKLISEGKVQEGEIKVINLGSIYGEYKDVYLKKSYFELWEPVERAKAVYIASEQDVSLLVQHNDPRSSTTIPYKTYDYLNIGNPIFALTKSEELKNLLKDNGHYSAEVDNIEQIADELLKVIVSCRQKKQKVESFLDPVVQAEKLITI